MRNEGRREDGFTLIELMIVVLIVAILIAVAIPVMNAASRKSKDRAVQADVQTALKAERAWFTDDELFTDDPAELRTVEGALDYENGDTPAAEGAVYLHVDVDGVVYLSALSSTGTCWYLRGAPEGPVGYAQSPTPCGTADSQTYQQRPW